MTRHRDQQDDDRRKFIRHPSDVPLEIRKNAHQPERLTQLQDLGFGGLSFVSSEFYDEGDFVTIRFPLSDGQVEFHGHIVWVEMISDRFPQKMRYGIKFEDAETLDKVRLIESICRKHTKPSAT